MTEPIVPEFETFEEMQEWLNSQTEKEDISSNSKNEGGSSKPSKKSTAKKTSGKKKAKKKPSKKDEGAKLSGATSEKPDASVWSSTHFYTQPGDTINKVRADAKEEAQYRNDNVRTFFHDHLFGEECNTRCGGV